MARFRGTVQGGGSEASRLGHSTSGLRLTANGWDQGVAVAAYADMGADVHRVWATGGSGNRGGPTLIAEISDASGTPRVTLYGKDGQVVEVYEVWS